MNESPITNRLIHSRSLYLRQHAHQPIWWYPWGEEAWSHARKLNRPVLLSIGYSACHWCHVQSHESFEDPTLAAQINAEFVAIKVDREERPDLDQIYQPVAQSFTGGGGWPLTVFLLPDQRPFFGGTYFPPRPSYGRPSFGTVLTNVADAFKREHQEVIKNAEALNQMISEVEASAKTEVKRISAPERDEALQRAATTLMKLGDPVNGGFGFQGPKFPQCSWLSFLWQWGEQLGTDTRYRDFVRLSLRRMARGGLYDHLGGGFHRYSVDPRWDVPHFEKMLYDNGLLLQLYAEVYLSASLDGGPDGDAKLFLQVIRETVGWLKREMTSGPPQFGFYASQDADSEGEEGKFFIWTNAELIEILGEPEADLFARRYQVQEPGNYENRASVLQIANDFSDLAQQIGASSVEELELRLERSRRLLWEAREKRVRPLRDPKILVSWNALMMSGLCWGGLALQRAGENESARDCFTLAWNVFISIVAGTRQPTGDCRLWSILGSTLNATLDDYAFLAKAALDLDRVANLGGFDEVSTASEDPRTMPLRTAHLLAESALRQFKDPEGGEFYLTSNDHEVLLQRPRSRRDQATPSGTAIMEQVIYALEARGQFTEGWTQRDQQKRSSEVLQSSTVEGTALCNILALRRGISTVNGPSLMDLPIRADLWPEQITPEWTLCRHQRCARYDSLDSLIKELEKVLPCE